MKARRNIGGLRRLALHLYDHLIGVVFACYWLAAIKNPRLKPYLVGREEVLESLNDLRKRRALFRHCVIFFCSSAGEYEQAMPLIDRFLRRPDTYVHVFLHSPAGLTHAKSKNPPHSVSLAPLDGYVRWQKVMSAVRPNVSIVVRNEFWPGFFAAASECGALVVVNLTASLGGRAKQWVKMRFLRAADQVFAVAKAVEDLYGSGTNKAKMSIVGDTKYDRVVERSLGEEPFLRRTQDLLNQRFGETRKLIVGSAYSDDLETVLQAFSTIRDTLRGRWQVVVVPHVVDSDTIANVANRCRDFGHSVCLYTELGRESICGLEAPPPVLIVDTVGRLAEFYGCADLALVGGGFSVGVHNILEAAAYGLEICFGPRFRCQMEACLFVEKGFAAVVEDANQLAAWWQVEASVSRGHRTRSELNQLRGAADAIHGAVSEKVGLNAACRLEA